LAEPIFGSVKGHRALSPSARTRAAQRGSAPVDLPRREILLRGLRTLTAQRRGEKRFDPQAHQRVQSASAA
jgi:hypothetical protein